MDDGVDKIEKARGFGFNIKGFPSELRDNFSKRREEIERGVNHEKAHS